MLDFIASFRLRALADFHRVMNRIPGGSWRDGDGYQSIRIDPKKALHFEVLYYETLHLG